MPNLGSVITGGASAFLLCVQLGGCGNARSAEFDKRNEARANNFAAAGDLRAIKQHGRLRILTLRAGALRDGDARRRVAHGLQLCESFAHSEGLEITLIETGGIEELSLGLLDGEGDLVCGELRWPDTSEITLTPPLVYPCRPQTSPPGDAPVMGRCSLRVASRTQNRDLYDALHGYLYREQLTFGPAPARFVDLDPNATLRLITRASPSTVFTLGGAIQGFEYQLLLRFAREQNLNVEIVLAPRHTDMIPMLLAGQGDVTTATVTAKMKTQGGVAFSHPYLHADEVIVASRDEPAFDSAAELRGHTIIARRDGASWQQLEALRHDGLAFELIPAPDTLSNEELIARVGRDEYDLAVASQHVLDAEMAWRGDIAPVWTLTESHPTAWAVRNDNRDLRAALDKFIRKGSRGLFYNWLRQQYFEDRETITERRYALLVQDALRRLSPHDGLVKHYAARYDFDWRLLVAMMFQESQFRPEAVSSAGALGLMQVMPRTARELGISELDDPENGIHAGVKYLYWLRERFEATLSIQDRMWFALAAYNAGGGHVRDARKLARENGWNPDRWFDNVERAMNLLSQPRYAKRAAHGRFRAQETINYVRKVHDRYRAYVALSNARNGLD